VEQVSRWTGSGNLPVLLINSNGVATNANNPMYRHAIVNFSNGNAEVHFNTFTAVVQNHTTVIISYDSNGGTGTAPSPETVNPGSSIILPNGSGLSKAGFIFAGWNTNASGTGTNYDAGYLYTPTGSITLYARWLQEPGTAGSITLSVAQITDGAPIFYNITLSRTNTGWPRFYTLSVNASDYDAGSIIWEIAGVGIHSGQIIGGNDPSFTLNAEDIRYNSIGGHVLKLTVWKNGMKYQRAIPFTNVQ
jgi:uncharacterized repeat protein (TIGR02543 family)